MQSGVERWRLKKEVTAVDDVTSQYVVVENFCT